METNAQYFDCLCRTCMNKVEASSHDGNTISQQQWIFIFDTIEECGEVRIAELLSDAVPQIVVQPSDELPKKICTECLQRLLSVYRFQQMCVQSDKEMHELLSKEQTVLKTPMLDGAIKGETETNDADSEPLKDLSCSSTLENLQQPSIQEPLTEVTVQTIDQETAQSSVPDPLKDNTQLQEHCDNSQGEFEEFIKNEPIEDDEANSEYSDGDTMHSTICVTKDEVLPIEFKDQQVNDAPDDFREFIKNDPNETDKSNTKYSAVDTMHSTISVTRDEATPIEPEDQQVNVTQDDCSVFVMNEPIEDDDNSNTENSDADTMQSTISVTKKEPTEQRNEKVKATTSRHNCHLCNKSYKRREYLRKHLNDHTKKANNRKEYCYACHLCNESYKKQQYLSRHLSLEHPNSSSHTQKSNLAKQPATHAEDKPQSEEEQQQPQNLSNKEIGQLSTDSILAEQRSNHAKDKYYECPYCPLRFSSGSGVSLHKKIHEGIKPHKCSICGKKFRQKGNLSQHKRIHSNEKPHKCDVCEKRFARSQQLKAHKPRHTGEKPFKCKYCQNGFATPYALSNHLHSHLGENIHRCKFCPLAFSSSAEMHFHLTTHKNEDPEVRERNLKVLQEEEAKLYNKEIDQPSSDSILAEQRSSLAEDKYYECPYCPLRFSSKIGASRHKLSHEGIKPHKCSICGKQFVQKSTLKVHKRIHSNEKPHKCDLCEKRFAEIQQLKVHIRTHTGEKPLKCKYCERGFAAYSILSKHLRGHLGKNIHRCNFCPLAFPLAAEMRLHLTSHKNDDPETRERNLKALQEEEVRLKLKFSKDKVKDNQQKSSRKRSCVKTKANSKQQCKNIKSHSQNL